MKPKAFRTQEAFRTWLAKNHAKIRELEMRLFKVHARHRGIGYREALDESLCWGWIDGVRHALDADSFRQRFTPRRPKSYWSKVNTKRFAELKRAGLVAAPGLAAFKPGASTRPLYTSESTVALSPALLKRIRADKVAWKHWEETAPGYKKLFGKWIMLVKRDETREKRFLYVLDRLSRGRLTREGNKL
jgi:uncharacterized protein YdeI (YjbR/CyaY-like superfamily)